MFTYLTLRRGHDTVGVYFEKRSVGATLDFGPLAGPLTTIDFLALAATCSSAWAIYSASREQHSRGDRRANARPAGDGDGAFERDSPNRLSASLARGLSFEKEKTKTVPADAASRSLSKSQNFSTGEALGGALSDARGPRACSAAPSTRTKTATAPAAPDFGGWDFMRDGVSTRGGGLFASPEKRESRKNETGEPVREPEPGTTHEASADARPRAYDARHESAVS